jgi:hypothetical protein
MRREGLHEKKCAPLEIGTPFASRGIADSSDSSESTCYLLREDIDKLCFCISLNIQYLVYRQLNPNAITCSATRSDLGK